jgi:hypothetical protein
MNQDSFEKELIRLGFKNVTLNPESVVEYKLVLNETEIYVTNFPIYGVFVNNKGVYSEYYTEDEIYSDILSIVDSELRSIKLKKLLNE